ncbi:hypothetical protein EBN03_30650 [Nocardia stercoris]|uniref:Uncharacterized protein n=1 Tax=Nocardia stercoris TaxID=2483361 RepID=A0A3M2KVE4_9NOCA|nr:hypothetical protein EBN03_30650 [Nocardia stercoris]
MTGWAHGTVAVTSQSVPRGVLLSSVHPGDSASDWTDFVGVGPAGTGIRVEVPRNSDGMAQPTAVFCRNSDCADLALAAASETDYAAIGVSPEDGFAVALVDSYGGGPQVIDTSVCRASGCTATSHVPVRSVGRLVPSIVGRGGDGLVVAYADAHQLHVISVDHQGAEPVTTSTGDVPQSDPSVTSIDVLPDGRPVLAVVDGDDYSTWLAICRDPQCHNVDNRKIMDGRRLLGPGAVVMAGSDGRPLVAGLDRDGNVTVYSCDDTECGTVTPRIIAGYDPTASSLTGTLDAGGRPVISTWTRHYSDNLSLVGSTRCDRRRCGA